jgi:hypothetical protein
LEATIIYLRPYVRPVVLEKHTRLRLQT